MLPASIPAKRAEMTFGYLNSHLPETLTPNPSGSAALYDSHVMMDMLLALDPLFVGMRRATIDRIGAVRQAIVYTMFTQTDSNGVKLYATYQRSNGSDAKLEGAWSIGFGGHVELDDIHVYEDPATFDTYDGVVDSVSTLIQSAERELEEEVAIRSLYNGQTAPLSVGLELPIDLIGFITDYKPEVMDWIGNTHLGILAEVQVDTGAGPEDKIEFAILESKYVFLGWKSLEELKSNQAKLESWSALTVDAL